MAQLAVAFVRGLITRLSNGCQWKALT